LNGPSNTDASVSLELIDAELAVEAYQDAAPQSHQRGRLQVINGDPMRDAPCETASYFQSHPAVVVEALLREIGHGFFDST